MPAAPSTARAAAGRVRPHRRCVERRRAIRGARTASRRLYGDGERAPAETGRAAVTTAEPTACGRGRHGAAIRARRHAARQRLAARMPGRLPRGPAPRRRRPPHRRAAPGGPLAAVRDRGARATPCRRDRPRRAHPLCSGSSSSRTAAATSRPRTPGPSSSAGIPDSAYNLAWYGGMHPVSYSVVSPYLMSLLGVRTTMMIAGTVSAALTALILVRVRAVRNPRGLRARRGLRASCATRCPGRVTFGLGMMFALGAVAAVFCWPYRWRHKRWAKAAVRGAARRAGDGGQPRSPGCSSVWSRRRCS